MRASGRVSGADVLSAVDGFAPAGMLVAAARLQTRQRAFNLVVTNVPGPQQPRYLLGRALRAIHPAMPLARNQGASVAAVSYDGRVCFGLLGDYDAAVAPDALAAALRDAIAELAPPER